MRVGIDIDDVLFPWYGKAHDACVTAGITNGVTPTGWYPYREYGTTEEAWLAVMATVTLDGSLYNGEPFPGTVEALKRLHDADHTIHLVTARGFFQHGHLIREHTVNWLAEYGIPHDTLTFTKDKTIVRTDVFADDAEKNIRALVAAGIPCCLIRAPHNGPVQHDWYAANISEFVDDVLEGYMR